MTAEANKPRRPPRAVVLVGTATALSLLGDQAFYPVLQTHGKDLGLAAVQVGILLSANRWIRLLTNHLAERLIHRVHTAWLLVGALVAGALVTAAYGFWPLFWALLAARIVWGLCWSLISQVGTMTCMDTAPPGAVARTVGFYSGLARVGSIVGMAAGAYLFNLLDFRLCFLIIAATMLLAVFPGFVSQRRLDGHPSEFRRPRGRTRRDHAFLLLVCAFAASCVGAGVIESTLGYVLRRYVGDSLTVGGAALGLATVTGVVLASRHVINLLGAPALGALADRIGHRRGTLAFFGIATVVLAAAAAATSALLVLALVMVFFVCVVSLNVILATEAGGAGSRAFAWYASASDLGAAFGPLFAWTMVELVPAPWMPFAIGSAISLIGMVAALVRMSLPKE